MKTKLFFTVFTFLFASNFSFASFPVNNNHINDSNIPTSKERVEELVRNSEITSDFNSDPTNIVADKQQVFKILSWSFSGASIICSLLSLSTDDEVVGGMLLIYGIIFLIPAIVFAILSKVF